MEGSETMLIRLKGKACAVIPSKDQRLKGIDQALMDSSINSDMAKEENIDPQLKLPHWLGKRQLPY